MSTSNTKRFCIAIGDSIRKNRIKNKQVSQDELFKILATHEIREDKDGPYFVFASFTGNVRNSESVDQYYGATIDIDGGSVDLKQIKKTYASYNYLVYTTFSHRAPDEQRVNKKTGKKYLYKFGKRYRIVLPYRKPVSPDRHVKATLYLASKLGNEEGDYDSTSKDISRGMYLPSCPATREKHARVFINDDQKNFNAKSSAIAEAISGAEFEAFDKTTYLDLDDDVEEGGRNNALAKIAGKLINQGVPLKHLLKEVLKVNDEKFKPPSSYKEVETTVKSIIRKHKKNPKEKVWGSKKIKRLINNYSEDNLDRIIEVLAHAKLKGHIDSLKQLRLIDKLKVVSKISKGDLKEAVREKEKQYKGEVKKEKDELIESNSDDIKRFLCDWCYVGSTDLVYNLDTGVKLKPQSFSKRLSTPGLILPMFQDLCDNDFLKRVDNFQFDPTKEQIFEMDRIIYANTHRLPEIFPYPGNGIKPILKHFKSLIPDQYERDIFLDYIAYLVQCPGMKIRWMPIIKGGKGIGKSLISDYIIMPIIGFSNFNKVSNKLVKSDFNDWQMNKLLIVFEELDFGGTYAQRLSLTESIKAFITDRILSSNPKGTVADAMYNKANCLGFTNVDQALVITDDERRFMMIKSLLLPKSKKYFERLTSFCESHIPEMYYYFLERDLSDFDPSTAPATDYTTEIKKMSLTWPGSIVDELKNDMKNNINIAGCATLAQIRHYIEEKSEGTSYMQSAENLSLTGSAQAKNLYWLLQQLGFTKYINPNYKDGRITIYKKLQTVWIFPGRESEYQTFRPKKIKMICEKLPED